jgi:hypothetical protein
MHLDSPGRFNNFQTNSLSIGTGNWTPELGKFRVYQAADDLEQASLVLRNGAAASRHIEPVHDQDEK